MTGTKYYIWNHFDGESFTPFKNLNPEELQHLRHDPTSLKHYEFVDRPPHSTIIEKYFSKVLGDKPIPRVAIMNSRTSDLIFQFISAYDLNSQMDLIKFVVCFLNREYANVFGSQISKHEDGFDLYKDMKDLQKDIVPVIEILEEYLNRNRRELKGTTGINSITLSSLESTVKIKNNVIVRNMLDGFISLYGAHLDSDGNPSSEWKESMLAHFQAELVPNPIKDFLQEVCLAYYNFFIREGLYELSEHKYPNSLMWLIANSIKLSEIELPSDTPDKLIRNYLSRA